MFKVQKRSGSKWYEVYQVVGDTRRVVFMSINHEDALEYAHTRALLFLGGK